MGEQIGEEVEGLRLEVLDLAVVLDRTCREIDDALPEPQHASIVVVPARPRIGVPRHIYVPADDLGGAEGPDGFRIDMPRSSWRGTGSARPQVCVSIGYFTVTRQTPDRAGDTEGQARSHTPLHARSAEKCRTSRVIPEIATAVVVVLW